MPNSKQSSNNIKTKILDIDKKNSFFKLSDKELLEILLHYSQPNSDIKFISNKLLENFLSLNDILYSPSTLILKYSNLITKNTILLFSLISLTNQLSLKEMIVNKNILIKWDNLINYLKIKIGYLPHEEFHIFFLNKKFHLIQDMLLAKGTVDGVPIYQREIINHSIKMKAHYIILTHNHPTGNHSPSKADITLTNQILNSLSTINICLIDHIIITRNSYFSFKNNSLL